MIRPLAALLAVTGWIVDASAAGTSPDAVAPDSDRAALLYENHCIGCHDSVLHVRGDRRAQTSADVSAQVARWSSNQGLGWTVEDVEQVTRFLVDRYYRFGGEPVPDPAAPVLAPKPR